MADVRRAKKSVNLAERRCAFGLNFSSPVVCNSGALAIEYGMIASPIGMVMSGAAAPIGREPHKHLYNGLEQIATGGPAHGARHDLFLKADQMSWSDKLRPALVLKDGRHIKTLSDARAVIRDLKDGQTRAVFWIELLINAAEGDKGAIRRVRPELSRALRRDGFI